LVTSAGSRARSRRQRTRPPRRRTAVVAGNRRTHA
jgi:hypothetical protein